MKEYSKNDNLDRYKPHKKLRRKAQLRRTRLFLLVYCCLAITILAFSLFVINYPFGKYNKPKPQNSAINTNDTDLYTDSIDDVENNVDETTWSLILVNRWNYIPDGYKVELTKIANGVSIDKRIYSALQKMFDTARSDNIYPIVASGYRTTEKQQSLMDEKVANYKAEGYTLKEATTMAEAWVAIPGTSEHQLGLGIDINADGIHSTGEDVYEWLNQNSYKFGFIHRYTSDKTDITGVLNEPWHYRYVGIKAATIIHNQGICLEEYLNKIH